MPIRKSRGRTTRKSPSKGVRKVRPARLSRKRTTSGKRKTTRRR